ncbi:MAG TPA: hypothetical protein VFE47_00880 [Tepidisphaeraceae bacterium]|jgi:hypothetical protein|nr:hypothetical protein [Tepidisphaeraceae bacterium]
MSVRISPGGAVCCRAVLHLPLPAISVWGQLRDFHRYASQDFFHADLAIDGHIPQAGARLKLSHRFLGIRIQRLGRILIWREGIGYSFSDLSQQGAKHGFPHIFSYRLEPTGEKNCRLHITVRGKWTARRIPKWAGKLWLRWVFSHVVQKVENQLLIYQLWRREMDAAATEAKKNGISS